MNHAKPICDALVARLIEQHTGKSPVIVDDEMGVGVGVGVADVVLIRRHTHDLHGFEIKSERDSLARLRARQVHYYSDVFDYVTLVCTPKHLATVLREDIVPTWWGLLRADTDAAGVVTLSEERAAQRNPLPDLRALEPLLWKKDMLELLSAYRIAHKSYHSKKVLWKTLTAGMTGGFLRDAIIDAFFYRNTRREWLVRWRSDGSYCREKIKDEMPVETRIGFG